MSFRNVVQGATASVAGQLGMVPAPPVGNKNGHLRGSGGWSPAGATLAASAGINTVETIVAQSAIAVPANSLVVGDSFRVTLLGTCTSSAANASTIAVRIGTAGTTADSVALTATTGVAGTSGTAVPFKIVGEFTVRTIGAAATLYGYVTVINGGAVGATGGFSQTATQVIAFTPSTIDSTAANFISATYLSAASTTTCTFQNGIVEMI